ncbi:MAG: hypothetical protein SVU32_04700, partial [Candidatus Nanohaloarchaea archaeon]|nr:hypothetical protein [Candidatus Nanohaloarchaea archaeon]
MDRRNAVIMLFFVLFTALVSATFYQISFRGIEVSQTSVEAGETINFTTNLVNLDDAPYTDVIVTAQLIRETDRTRVARTTVNSDVDLAAREVTAIRGELTVPEDAPGGSYTLNLQ